MRRFHFSWGFIYQRLRGIIPLFYHTIIVSHLRVFFYRLVLLFDRFIFDYFLLFLLFFVNLNMIFLFWYLFLWLFLCFFLLHHCFWTFYNVVNIAQFLSHYLYSAFMDVCLWSHVLYSFFVWVNFLRFIMFRLAFITQNIVF